MNIIKYSFEKNLNKNSDIYSLEIYLPLEFNKFSYKIYGDKGLIEIGNLQIFRNYKLNNILTIPVSIIQTLFLTFIYSSNNIEKEYYDFIDLHTLLESKHFNKKNIILNIIKQDKSENIKEDEIEEDEENDEDEDEKKEDSDEEKDDSDEEDSDEEDDDDEEDEKKVMYL